MKIYLISDNVDTLTGFRLVGVEGAVVHTREEVAQAIDFALADKEIGIVLVVENLSNKFPDLINKVRLYRRVPLLVEIPDRHGTGRRPDFITAYVREAIGVKL